MACEFGNVRNIHIKLQNLTSILFKIVTYSFKCSCKKISQPFQHGEVAKLRDTVHVTKTIHLHFSHTKNSQQVLCLTG